MSNQSYIVCDSCDEVYLIEGSPSRLRIDPKLLCSFIQNHIECQGDMRFISGWDHNAVVAINGYKRYQDLNYLDCDKWDSYFMGLLDE